MVFPDPSADATLAAANDAARRAAPPRSYRMNGAAELSGADRKNPIGNNQFCAAVVGACVRPIDDCKFREFIVCDPRIARHE
jgi:hypothetical protein